MSTDQIYLGLGLLPAFGLLFYIYKMDRIEKEPKGLLVGLFFLGVGAAVPTVILELLTSSLNNAIFYGRFTTDYQVYFVNGKTYLYEFVNNFLGIALVEEGFKWLFMFLLTRKNKNFNCLFDGVVYAAFVSLGFAAIENVFYVFTIGLYTAVLRMLTAVPAHCAFSVVMGYFYSRWFVCRNAGALEKHLYMNGVITAAPTGFGAGKYLALSLAVPTLFHGFYDFCCVFTAFETYSLTALFWVLLILFMGFLAFLVFRNVFVLSRKDAYIPYMCMEMVLDRHPMTDVYICRMPEHTIFFTPQIIEQSIASGEIHGVKTTANNYYYAHPLPAVKPKPAPRPVAYPRQTQYAQPMNNQYYGQQQYAQPMNNQYYGQQQYAQPANNQYYGQQQYAQPMNNQYYGQQQYAQPANDQYYGQQQQYAQPAPYEEPYTRQLDNLEPVGGYRPYGGAPSTQLSRQNTDHYYR